jgi:hypothetical protein
MRNLTKGGLDFYSPQRTISVSRSFGPLLDREEVRYPGRDNAHTVLRRRLSRVYMGASRSVRDPRAIVVIAIAAILMALPSIVMLGSDRGEAGLFPVNVRGYIMDLAGNKLQGANVTIEIINETSGLTTKTLYYDSTLSSGLYSVTFEGAYWDPGDTIKVTAKYGGDTVINQTRVNDRPIQYVNVTMSVEIPEFGSLFGLPTFVLSVGLVAAVIVVGRRRQKAR